MLVLVLVPVLLLALAVSVQAVPAVAPPRRGLRSWCHRQVCRNAPSFPVGARGRGRECEHRRRSGSSSVARATDPGPCAEKLGAFLHTEPGQQAPARRPNVVHQPVHSRSTTSRTHDVDPWTGWHHRVCLGRRPRARRRGERAEPCGRLSGGPEEMHPGAWPMERRRGYAKAPGSLLTPLSRGSPPHGPPGPCRWRGSAPAGVPPPPPADPGPR